MNSYVVLEYDTYNPGTSICKMLFAVLIPIVIGVFIGYALSVATHKSKEGFAGVRKPFVLHYYSMSRCPHCLRFNPTWEDLANKNKLDHVTFRKTVREENPIAVMQANVKGFPTIRAEYPDGVVVPYTGNRSPTDLQNFISSL